MISTGIKECHRVRLHLIKTDNFSEYKIALLASFLMVSANKKKIVVPLKQQSVLLSWIGSSLEVVTSLDPGSFLASIFSAMFPCQHG